MHLDLETHATMQVLEPFRLHVLSEISGTQQEQLMRCLEPFQVHDL